MAAKVPSPDYVLGLLVGKWRGEGRGSYPTIEAFDYVETLTFERRDEYSLFYMQRTEKRLDGQDRYVTSHWESGFLRGLTTDELELANVQSGGRGEVLIGKIDNEGRTVRLDFRSKVMTNDERMVSTARTFEIEGNTLRYEMLMRTIQIDKLTRHLIATLKRVE